MALDETIGERIRRLRRAKQVRLGRKYRRNTLAAEVQVTPSTVVAWEEDTLVPVGPELERLSVALGVNPDYVLRGGSGTTHRPTPSLIDGIRTPTPEFVLSLGDCLWHVQVFEEILAHCIVFLVTGAHGIGVARGEGLIRDARELTLGAKVAYLSNHLQMDADFEARLSAAVRNRNWFVHSARLAWLTGDEQSIIDRLGELSTEATACAAILTLEVEKLVMAHGVTAESMHAALEVALEAQRSRRP